MSTESRTSQPETRDRILDAAERLFVEHGFEGTSMRMITGAANANLAAVNYHFGSKDALIQAVFRRRLTALNEARLAALDNNEELGFKDSYRVGLGMQYQYTDALRLRAGVAYDQSPVRKAEDRTVRLPDSDRTWLAVGFNYKLTKQTSIDAGYARLFFDKEKIDRRTVLGTTQTAQFVRGSFDTSVNIFSVQLNHAF